MEQRLSSNCIFCNNAASRGSVKVKGWSKPVDDNLPRLENPLAEITQDDSGSEPGAGNEEFWKAFKLFCKLLLNEGESIHKGLLSMEGDAENDKPGGDAKDNLKMDHSSCSCGDCYRTVMNVLRLQIIIEQSLAEQRNHFEILKHSLVINLDGHPPVLDPIWEPLRAQLTNCLSAKMKQELRVSDWTYGDFEDGQDTSSPFFDGESPGRDHEDDIVVSSDKNRGNLPTQDMRPSESPPFPTLTATNGKLDNFTTRNPPKVKSCSVKLTRLNLDDIASLIRGLGDNHSDRTDERPLRRKHPSVKPKSKSEPRVPYHFNDNFFHVAEDILLFQCTPIRVSRSEFTCLEPGCTHVEGGSDYFTFQNMNAHIINNHEANYDCKETCRSCPVCGEAFTTGINLRRHILSNHCNGRAKASKVICPSCFKQVWYTEFRNHLWRHKNEEEISAAVASGEKLPRWLLPKKKKKTPLKTIMDKDDMFYKLGDNHLLHKHVLIEHTPIEFTCQIRSCGIRISGSDYFTFHEFKSHVKDYHKCNMTNTFERYAQGPKYICPLCQAEFTESSDFTSHVHSEHSPPSVCVSCWKPLGSTEEMGKHAKLHMNLDELSDLDRPSYNPPSNYRPWNAYHPKQDSYSCKFCHKKLKHPCDVRAHEMTHAPKHLRPHFDCPECGLKLLSNKALVGHIERKHRAHDSTKKRECHICKAQFFYMDGERYRIHMRSHTGETPWICDVCGKGFTSNEQYLKHITTVHSTEQNYQCEFCEKRFKQKQAFKTHQRKAHKGLVKELDAEEKLKATYKLEDRPGFIGPKIAYPCEYCGKIFPIRSLMTKHVNNSHAQPT